MSTGAELLRRLQQWRVDRAAWERARRLHQRNPEQHPDPGPPPEKPKG